jgi:hypothetical protein
VFLASFRASPAGFFSVGLRLRGRHALFPPKGEEKKGKGKRERHARKSLEHDRGRCHPVRMLIARAKIIPIVISEAPDWTSIRSLAAGLSGIVSVGLKAVALVNEV